MRTETEMRKRFSVLICAHTLSTMLLAASACGPGSKEDGEGGNDGAAGSKGQAAGDPVTCEGAVPGLPAARLGRLTVRQYARTLAAAFDFKVDETRIPTDAPSGHGFAVFDTTFADKQVSEQHFNSYSAIAEEVAKSQLPKIELAHTCLFAQPDDACVDSFVSQFGERAFRRPLETEELSRWSSFFTAAREKWDAKVAARMVVEALLQSPHHLYRSEVGAAKQTESGSKVELTPFEKASELSYALTDGPPDAMLYAAARDGALSDRRELMRQARRLVTEHSDIARGKLQEFLGQLLGVTPALASNLGKDTTVFKEFSPALRSAMLKETETFLDHMLTDESSLRELYSARHSYIDRSLAELYGVDSSGRGDEFVRSDLPASRRGLLSQAAFLSVSSHADRTSPSMRGTAVLNRLLCQERPAAPPGAADSALGTIFSPTPRLTQREHWSFALATAPQCTSCHQHFVPIGLGFEQFDAMGRHREKEFDKTIDPSIEISGIDDSIDGRYDDGLSFAEKIISTPYGQECLVTQLRTFALGAAPNTDEDRCEVTALADRFADNDLRLIDLLVDLASTDSFSQRRWPAP